MPVATRLLLLALLIGVAAPVGAQMAPVLLVPDSINDRILALDPTTGDVSINPWIEDAARFGTVVQVIQAFDGHGLFVADQTGDVVLEYDDNGAFVREFAPAGGVDTAVLDNMRGIALSPDGERLLVTVASGGNANSIVAFDRSGQPAGSLVAVGANGLDSPWSLLFREDDLLVGASGTRAILRYGLDGTPIDTFATIDRFPQQIARSAAGTVLVANFSTATTRGVYEYAADGTPVGVYQLGDLQGAPRGVHELPGGTLLVSTSAGIYEIDRTGAILSTKVTGGQYRYIEPASVNLGLAAGPAAGADPFVLVAPWPNPARATASVRLDVPGAQHVRLAVYDLLGRRVLTLHDGPAAGALVRTVDAAALAPGLYVVRAEGATAQAAQRLVVAR
jgi:hypothetical protein